MAQGWPSDDTLQNFREAFHLELEKKGLFDGPEEFSIRQTAHASLCVFTNALLNSEGLTEYIEKNRETDYGTSEIKRIDVVKYKRTATDVGLLVFASHELI